MFSVRRIYLAIRPPAPSRVFTRSCERPLPAQCPRSIHRRWIPSDRRNRCTCAWRCRDISRWGCIVYSPTLCGLLVRRSVKVLVKLSRARFMREVRGDKDIRRSGRAWARAADTWRLVSVACPRQRSPAARRAWATRTALPASTCMYCPHREHFSTQWAFILIECRLTGTRQILWLIIEFPSDNRR